MKILVVEDDAVQRRMLVDLLEMHGYTVEQAGTIEEARKLGGAHCAVIDVHLPNGDGRQLKEERNAALSIMISGDESVSGALKKPFKPEELLERLRWVEKTLAGAQEHLDAFPKVGYGRA